MQTHPPFEENPLPASRYRTHLLFALLVATAVLLASCATTDGKKAGNFSIHVYQSGGVLPDSETTLQAVLDQGKPVVLNFWAGDCPPCRAEMPTLEASWRQHREDLVMLGVDIGPYMGLGTFESGQKLLEQTGITYPAGNTPDASFISDYNLVGLPMTFFMLPDGTIHDSWTGGIASDQLNRRISDLISANEN